MKIIDGHGVDEHISARQIADINIAIFGAKDYVLNSGEKFAYEILTNNKIQIKSGSGISQGVRFCIPENNPDEVFIENGAQLKYRHDLIVAEYVKDGATTVESFNLKVIKGTPADSESAAKDPEVVTGNLRNNELKHQVPLYRVCLNGLSIEKVEQLFKVRNLAWINWGPKANGLPSAAGREDGEIFILY